LFLIGRAMIAFVKTAFPEFRESLLDFFDDGNRDLIIGFVLHHPVVQDKLKLIFDNTNLYAQFHRDTGFAFADPFGVRLKQGKDLFPMRDGFMVDDPPPDLIHLSFRMDDILLNLIDVKRNEDIRRIEIQECLPDSADIILRRVNVGLVSGDNQPVSFRFFHRIFCSGVF